jgi:hypothetical protein
MKRLLTLSLTVFFTIAVFAQSPQMMSYQAVIRNSSDVLIANHAVGMKISILKDATPVYVETQTPNTNSNGLISIEIGGGTPVTGTFAGIDWSAGTYFIQTEIDPLGGNAYTITGTSQLLSVPYALYAKASESSTDAVKLTGNQTITGNKTFSGTTTVQTPVSATDAATKAYVDLHEPSHYIGESYGGGIVFYVYDNGKHGLIAATTDQSTAVVWTNTASYATRSNAVRDGINGGLANTERIIIQAGTGSYAAQLCANYKSGNYADWYLPSIYELNLLYVQKAVVGGFAIDYYWSSSEYEYNFSYAYALSFSDGFSLEDSKLHGYPVRCIRSF